MQKCMNQNYIVLKKETDNSNLIKCFFVPCFKELSGHHHKVTFYFTQEMNNDSFAIVCVDLATFKSREGPAEFHKHNQTEYYMMPDYPEKVIIEVEIEDTISQNNHPYYYPYMLDCGIAALL